MSHNEIKAGVFINYKLKIHGVPARWTTLIREWAPNNYFIDQQLKGPYKIWHHTHSFHQTSKGVIIKDKILYQLPIPFFGDLIMGYFIKKDVQQIFEYRKNILKKIIK